jgi:hypothetical protein
MEATVCTGPGTSSAMAILSGATLANANHNKNVASRKTDHPGWLLIWRWPDGKVSCRSADVTPFAARPSFARKAVLFRGNTLLYCSLFYNTLVLPG